MNIVQKNKIKFLENQGGEVVTYDVKVVQMPDGKKALIDEFGRCDWVVTNEAQDKLTRHAIASQIAQLPATQGLNCILRGSAERVAMNCREGLE